MQSKLTLVEMTEETNQPSSDSQPDPLTIGGLISLTEAAELSGFSHDYLRDIATSGRLKARKIGRNWVTTLKAIEEYKRTRKFIAKEDNPS